MRKNVFRTKFAAPSTVWAILALWALALPSFAADPADAQLRIDLDAARLANPMPDAAAVANAIRKQRPTIDRAMAAPNATPQVIPDIKIHPAVPNARMSGVDILNTAVIKARAAAAPKIDISDALAAINGKGSPKYSDQAAEFLLFVSFSIPDDKLRKLFQMAGAAGIITVFRGPIDENDLSAMRFAAKLKRVVGHMHIGEIDINPPLFSRFKVTSVPSYVLADRIASGRELDGCAPPTAYEKVEGDLSPEFALNVIHAHGQSKISADAERRLRKLRGHL